ncbi:MAG: TrmB family transcriptional regulator [Candidatus Hodarchaeales archaeon]|jgi:sugar-specific transcriptional regulator TrmB
MSDEIILINKLKSIGLTEYESKVFYSLFKKSPQGASMLVESGGISRGRIYGVLKELEKKELIIVNISKGSSNTYELVEYPKCLINLKNRFLANLKRNFEEIENILSKTKRKVNENILEDVDGLFVLKTESATSYYVKKLIEEAKEEYLTNFTGNLLLKYKSSFLKTKDSQVKRKFIVTEFDKDRDDLKEILEYAEVHFIGIKNLNIPIMKVFKDVRPSMVISDNTTGIILFSESGKDALYVKNHSFLSFQKQVLGQFIEGSMGKL